MWQNSNCTLKSPLHRSELRAVVARIDRADERETLEKILKTAKITVMDIKNPEIAVMDIKNQEVPDRQPQTNNVKKNLLHRYRSPHVQ